MRFEYNDDICKDYKLDLMYELCMQGNEFQICKTFGIQWSEVVRVVTYYEVVYERMIN